MKTNTGLMLKVAEFLAHNTVKIEGLLKNGEYSIGTGFLYQFFSNNGTPYPALVTNKHVLNGAKDVTLLFNPRGRDNKADFKNGSLPFLFPVPVVTRAKENRSLSTRTKEEVVNVESV